MVKEKAENGLFCLVTGDQPEFVSDQCGKVDQKSKIKICFAFLEFDQFQQGVFGSYRSVKIKKSNSPFQDRRLRKFYRHIRFAAYHE